MLEMEIKTESISGVKVNELIFSTASGTQGPGTEDCWG